MVCPIELKKAEECDTTEVESRVAAGYIIHVIKLFVLHLTNNFTSNVSQTNLPGSCWRPRQRVIENQACFLLRNLFRLNSEHNHRVSPSLSLFRNHRLLFPILEQNHFPQYE